MRTEDMPVIDLQGNARQRGRQHGEALRAPIRDITRRLRESLAEAHKLDPNTIIDDFLGHTSFPDAMRRWTPDVLEEIEGIIEGSGAAPNDVLVHNLADEIWCHGFKTRVREWAGPFHHCSAAGGLGRGDAPTVAGQNMDIGSWNDGFQVLLRVSDSPDMPDALLFTVAGCVVLTGLNRFGVGVNVNSLLDLDNCGSGLPVASVIRGALCRQSAAEAVRFITGIRHASGQNYLVSGRGELHDLECSANGAVALMPPDRPADRVWHTNHALASRDDGQYRAIVEALPAEKRSGLTLNTCTRMRALERRLADTSTPVTLDVLIETFRSSDDPSAPVSKHANREKGAMAFTAGCAIFEMPATGDPSLHLAAGPPDITNLARFDFAARAPSQID